MPSPARVPDAELNRFSVIRDGIRKSSGDYSMMPIRGSRPRAVPTTNHRQSVNNSSGTPATRFTAVSGERWSKLAISPQPSLLNRFFLDNAEISQVRCCVINIGRKFVRSFFQVGAFNNLPGGPAKLYFQPLASALSAITFAVYCALRRTAPAVRSNVSLKDAQST